MQFRLISAFLIFIGSYFPLAVILAVQDIPNDWWEQPICGLSDFMGDGCKFDPFVHATYAFVFLAITGVSVLILWAVLKLIPCKHEINVVNAKAIPNEIINYTFPYVVSFMGIDFGDTGKLLGFLVFLAWMFVVTYKSGQVFMNPILFFFGWKLYSASIDIGHNMTKEVLLLKQGDLVPGKHKAEAIQSIYICKG